MYVFAKNGILSIVAHRNKPSMLMVRAVARGDIEQFWPNAKIIETDDSDYRFRITLSRKDVATKIADAVATIDYDKVKPSVSAARQLTYLQVWEIMMELQAS